MLREFRQDINGAQQYIAVRGNQQLPLLLVLHGGPGMALSFARDTFLSELEDQFQIVLWDQRGCGKSPSDNLDPSSLTMSQLIQDTIAVAEFVRNEYEQDIYIFGHSWGGTLGLYVVQKAPALFNQFFCVNPWLIDDEKAIAERKEMVYELLDEYPLIQNQQWQEISKALEKNDLWPHDVLKKFGLKHENQYDFWDYHMEMMEKSHAYSWKDVENYYKSFKIQENLYDDIVSHYNVLQDIAELRTPTTFFISSNDLITVPGLGWEYATKMYDAYPDMVNGVELPDSSHYPFFEKPAWFSKILLHAKQEMEITA